MNIVHGRPDLFGRGADHNAQRMLSLQAQREAEWGYITNKIGDPKTRRIVEQLLDNQKAAGLFEDDTTADIPLFTTIALAFVQKVYPALLINEIADIQPMSGPTAKVFFEDFIADQGANGSFTHGEGPALTDPSVQATGTDNGTGSTLPTGNLYVAYSFANASGESKLSAVSAAVSITATHNLRVGSVTLPAGATNINYYMSISPDSQVLAYVGTKTATGTFDITAMPGSGAAAPPTANTTGSPITAEGANVQKTRYKLTSSTVTAQKWALMVQWTTELQEDLRAQYNQDLTSKIFDYISRELIGNIDYTAITTIIAGIPAGNQVTWSKTAASGYTQRDWDQTIYGAIVDASIAVEKARFRHPDYIVCSPGFAARLEKLETFKAVGWPVGRDDEMQMPGMAGPNVFGTVAGRWTVYRSPWVGEGSGGFGRASVGIKGEGFIYAPYIPLQLGPLLPIPGTDELARTMRTRAGMIQTITNAFGLITVTT